MIILTPPSAALLKLLRSGAFLEKTGPNGNPWLVKLHLENDQIFIGVHLVRPLKKYKLVDINMFLSNRGRLVSISDIAIGYNYGGRFVRLNEAILDTDLVGLMSNTYSRKSSIIREYRYE